MALTQVDTNMLAGVRAECQFQYTSTSVCTLARYGGKYLFINGKNEIIPSAGVTLSNATLGASDTTYYVYAYMNAGTMTLEVSATGYASDTTYGHPTKSGDATRTLVGLVRKTGGNFYDQAGIRFTLSYWNRTNKNLYANLGGTTAGSSTSGSELHSNTRAYFLCWGDESQFGQVVGSTYGSSGSSYCGHSLYLDGAGLSNASYTSFNSGGNDNYSATATHTHTPSLGYHYYSYGYVVGAGTVNFQAGSSTFGMIRG